MPEYLDCIWRFILTSFIYCWLWNSWRFKLHQMSYILTAGGLVRTICGMKADIPKVVCLGFTLNLKCVHLIGNVWWPHLWWSWADIYLLVVIHRALVLPVSKQNIIQRQPEFRQPVGSVLNVKRSLKCPGPQLSQKFLGLWSALSTPDTALDILNQLRREVLSGLTRFLVTLSPTACVR